MCLLDPDGDLVRHLAATGAARRHPGWACYHTDMWLTDTACGELGVVGMAVGAPFAVPIAEQLHASGADLVLSQELTVAPSRAAVRSVRQQREGLSSDPWRHISQPTRLRERRVEEGGKQRGQRVGGREPRRHRSDVSAAR